MTPRNNLRGSLKLKNKTYSIKTKALKTNRNAHLAVNILKNNRKIFSKDLSCVTIMEIMLTDEYYKMDDIFPDCTKIETFSFSEYDTSKLTTALDMFNMCFKLVALDLSNFDTSNITMMAGMFCGCKSLASLNLSNFDTSKVLSMNGMFNQCEKFTSLDLSSFDTSNVIDMKYMFYKCENLASIKGIIDMKTCIDYSKMFQGCTRLSGVKIKNPPTGFDGAGLKPEQYEIVD